MESTAVKRVIVVALVLAGLLAVWVIQNHRSSLKDSSDLVSVSSGRFLTMGTFAEINLRCRSQAVAEKALAAAMAALDTVDKQMNIYRPDSELSIANSQAALQDVPISQETYSLLNQAIDICRISGGAFDITVGPLLGLWNHAADTQTWPAQSEIDNARQLVGYQMITLSAATLPTVRLARPGMSLNLNAMAKGYGVDRVLQAVRIDGVTAALVNIGGEIACFATGNGDPWLIGIQDPFIDAGAESITETIHWTIELNESAIATSGNYRQYRQINGQRYSHIVDPRSGMPADKLPSVTIIAASCAQADALATAVSVLGPRQGLKLIESLPNTEAFLIAGTVDRPVEYKTPGFDAYIVNPVK